MSLTTYLTAYLGNLADSFDLEDDFYSFIVTEALSKYGVSTEDEATDLTKLYKLGVLALWDKLLVKSSVSFDFSANGGSYKTSQLYEMVKSQFLKAYADAIPYLDEYEAEVVNYSVSGSTTDEEYYSGW